MSEEVSTQKDKDHSISQESYGNCFLGRFGSIELLHDTQSEKMTEYVIAKKKHILRDWNNPFTLINLRGDQIEIYLYLKRNNEVLFNITRNFKTSLF